MSTRWLADRSSRTSSGSSAGFAWTRRRTIWRTRSSNLRPTAPQYLHDRGGLLVRRRVPSDDARADLAGSQQPGRRRRHLVARRDVEPDLSGDAEEQVHGVRALQPAPGGLQPVRRHELRQRRGVYFTHRPEYLLQTTWTNPLTNRLLLEGGFTFYNERWIFGPEPYNINGYGPDAVVSKIDSSVGVLYGAAQRVHHCGQPPVQHALRGELRDRQPRLQGRHDGHVGHAALSVRHEPGAVRVVQQRHAVADHRVREAADRHGAPQRGARHLRAGSLDDQPADAEPRPPLRLPQRHGAGAGSARRFRSSPRAATTRSTTCRTGRTSRRASAATFDLFGNGTHRRARATTGSTSRANRRTWRR